MSIQILCPQDDQGRCLSYRRSQSLQQNLRPKSNFKFYSQTPFSYSLNELTAQLHLKGQHMTLFIVHGTNPYLRLPELMLSLFPVLCLTHTTVNQSIYYNKHIVVLGVSPLVFL